MKGNIFLAMGETSYQTNLRFFVALCRNDRNAKEAREVTEGKCQGSPSSYRRKMPRKPVKLQKENAKEAREVTEGKSSRMRYKLVSNLCNIDDVTYIHD